MIKQIQQNPKYWLDLKTCENIYNSFRKKQKFQEPLDPFNSRYEGSLEGILGAIQQTFDKKLLYPTILDAAAGYFYKINCGHPFRNGNKRMSVLFTHLFLYIHNIDFSLSFKDMYAWAATIAKSSENGTKTKKVEKLCRKIIAENTVKI
jgi:prophage maintenance system killer protein